MKKLFCVSILLMVFTGTFTHRARVLAKESINYAKCAPPVVETAFKISKAVFTGKVLNIREDGDDKVFTFQIENNWKGINRKKVEIRIHESTRYQAWYQVGGRYLIFARADENGALRDKRCSGSKNIRDAAEDIQKLQKLKKSAK